MISSTPDSGAGTTSRIENYLGFPTGLSGADLTLRAREQAIRFGAEILVPSEVAGLRREDPYTVVRLADGTEVHGDRLLIATGVRARQWPNAEEAALEGVYTVRTKADAARLQAALAAGPRRVLIIGSGK